MSAITTPTSANLRSLTPVIVVDIVEPSIAFWTERLGFVKENEVPAPDGTLIFASVKKGDVEIMYQTKASVVDDNPHMAGDLTGHSITLFITVASMADLDAIERQLSGVPVVKPRHDTFYGTTEIYVREPGGAVVGFAAHK